MVGSVHRAFGIVAAAVLLAGCGSVRPFRCPDRGGAPWRELANEHFVLRTDLDSHDARVLLDRLERMRAAVLAALFDGAPESPGRVEVVAFRSERDFEEFAPKGVTAYYLRYAGGPPRIVLSSEIRSWQRALLAHELTHHYLAAAFARLPRWLGEGLAVYMESLGEQGTDAEIVVGGAPADRLARAREGAMPVRELLAWDGTLGTRESLDFYASSWLLVHFLAHKRGAEFAELQRRLAAGEPPESAWPAAFPEYARPENLVGLDRALTWYARTELPMQKREVRVEPGVEPFEQRMPPAEVHALRLALWSHGPQKSVTALRAEVTEALLESPDHPVALQFLARFDDEDPIALARRAVAAWPDDARAWTFLGNSLGDYARREREQAYRRALDLAPDNPAALHNLAVELREDGRPGEALPLARRAVELAPWSPPLLAAYAAVQSDLGQCGVSIPLTQRALEALPDRTPRETRAELRDRLLGYARQCGYAVSDEPRGAR
ncbi:MAG TPA: tetratricopeptide repeat protein [Anaeromyxobacteraceae bacterium]|nr:tetratricopeptide repeat protein [Anaeromyxobacteraceae bacterium]